MENMPDDLQHLIALGLVPQVGVKQARILLDHFGDAREIFRAGMRALEKIPGMGDVRARSIRSFRDFKTAEKEIAFLHKYRITPLRIGSPGYPKRLLNCDDAPTLLFFKGNASLNHSRIISVIGTRRNTEYGKSAITEYMEHWRAAGIMVISGLAFGVDALAHRNALKLGMYTVGVLGHGLDRIYPDQHRRLAREMTEQGGLLTEFLSGTKPDKQNFPKRNRIVAGISDAVFVVESGISGGSMITAGIANSYNRDVFALPGRINDIKSKGCNYLIRNHQAQIADSPEEIIRYLNWDLEKTAPSPVPEIHADIKGDHKKIMGLLSGPQPMHTDDLLQLSGLDRSAFSSALLFLEMEGHLVSLPGKRYARSFRNR